MSTNTKKSKSSEETLEKLCAFINEKGGIVKKEEFAALDVDYRKILEFVEAGTLVRIKNGLLYRPDRPLFRGRTDRTAVSGCASVHGKCALCVWIYPGKALRMALSGG